MSERQVRLAATEQTQLHLRESAGLCTEVVRKGRLTGQQERTLVLGTWTLLLSFTEFYVDEIVDRLLAIAEESSSRERYLIGQHRRQAFDSWDRRISTLDNLFQLKLKQHRCWEPLDAAIWVRNGIAHGRGGVSRKQNAREGIKAEGLGVSIIEDRLVVPLSSLGECLTACTDFVEILDLKARPHLIAKNSPMP